MGLGQDIGRILEQYSAQPSKAPPEQVEQDFDHIARHAPSEDLSNGLTEAFRSDQTPPFGNMIGQLFGQADPRQRSGMLNQLLSGAGPALVASLMGGGGLGGLLNHGGGQ